MKEVNRKKSLLILLSATLIIGVLVFVLLLFSARTFSICMLCFSLHCLRFRFCFPISAI